MRNYHTHTFRCKHAEGDVDDFIKFALGHKFSLIGFSDHTPLPDNKCPIIRMNMDQLQDYVQTVNNAKEKFENIIILTGMECEYLPEYHNFYMEEYIDRLKLDYLVSGQHIFYCKGELIHFWEKWKGKDELIAYAEHLVASMESGLFDFIAHPDCFGNFYRKWDANAIACSKYIAGAAEYFKIPLEINAYGLRKNKIKVASKYRNVYPLDKFWEIVSQYDVKVIINSDAHSPEDLITKLDKAFNIAYKYDLTQVDDDYLIHKIIRPK